MRMFDAAATRRLLDYTGLIATLEGVLAEYGRGEIACPERLVVPCGPEGLMLSMPCIAGDIAAHKLITIYRNNPAHGLAALQGSITCYDGAHGTPLFSLDGPTATAHRTAAISLIGVRRLLPAAPRAVLLIGTGPLGVAHCEAILDQFPDTVIGVRARRDVSEFCGRFPGGRVRPAEGWAGARDAEVVIAATSSRAPVYDEPARAGRLVVGVGAYRLDMVEIGPRTIGGSLIFLDDPVGAPSEAGDLVAAGIDWGAALPLAGALDAAPDFSRPIFLKSVGCAAWDLAACRAALRAGAAEE